MAYRVLIADDSPAMRAFVRRVLGLSGFELSECFEAGNGEAPGVAGDGSLTVAIASEDSLCPAIAKSAC